MNPDHFGQEEACPLLAKEKRNTLYEDKAELLKGRRPEKLKHFLLIFIVISTIFFFLRIKEQEDKVMFQGRAGEEREDLIGDNEEIRKEETASEAEKSTENQFTVEKSSTDHFTAETSNIDHFTAETSNIDYFTAETSSTNHFTAEKSSAEVPCSETNKISDKVNINTASLEELQSLKGVGPATAKNIILYREEYGAFSDIEEIMNVKRIGEKTFAKIKDFITVE